MATKSEIQHEALEVSRKWKRCGAAISMGVGKTRLGLNHFQLVENKYQADEGRSARGLVVASRTKILKGWKAEAKEIKKTKLEKGLDYVNYRSIHKMDPTKYDVVYLDECHSLLPHHEDWLKLFDGYILGLTGTPPKRKTSEKGRLIEKYCPIKYEYLTDEAVDDKILNDYKITVHTMSLSKDKTLKIEIKDKKTKKITKSWYTSEQANYEYWSGRIHSAVGPGQRSKLSIMRMSAMKTYPTKDAYGKRLLDQSSEQCILFANTQAQADKLCSHSYHSNNKDSEANMEKFELGIIDKLSCVLQLSEGANIAGLKECIILHAYGNNKTAAQRIGRMLRLNPDDTAHIHILCFKDTVDEKWVREALADFNPDKIEWFDTEIF